ncbi:hypothetical protein KBA27_06605, partial [bacterium]|nr:hypothetical protein [bacterium]
MQRRNKLLIALMIMTVFAGRTQATVDNVSTWSGLSNSITAGNSATLTGDIASDVTSTITNSNSVATAISVDFATHVINANSSTGAILNNGTLTLKSGTLENFKSSTGVSALKNTKNLTIDSQIVDNNNVITPTDDAQGGGIYNGSSATLTVQNSSTISNNTATSIASGKVASGGGIYNEGTTNITGSTVNSNIADAGGGIYNVGTTTLS